MLECRDKEEPHAASNQDNFQDLQFFVRVRELFLDNKGKKPFLNFNCLIKRKRGEAACKLIRESSSKLLRTFLVKREQFA